MEVTYYSSPKVSKLRVCVRKPLCELYVGDEFAVEEGVAGVAHVVAVVADVEVDVAVVGIGVGVVLMLIEFNEMPL